MFLCILFSGDGMNLFDRFLYKLLIMVFMLLAIVSLDKLKILNLETLQAKLSTNINILKVIQTLNGKTNIVFLDLSDVESVSGNVYESIDITGGKRIILHDYEAIESLTLGMVVRIDDKDIYILDSQNKLYCYKDVSNCDVSIYQIIRKNQIIGKANVDKDGINYYDVYIKENG